MKCYLETRLPVKGNKHYGRVVTEQDYRERGPHAYSHQTAEFGTKREALAAAREWAEERGYAIYSVDEIAA
jgi:hypothetical protein